MIRGAGDVVGSALLYKGPEEEGCCAFYMREAHRRCCEGLPMSTSHVKRIASLSSKPLAPEHRASVFCTILLRSQAIVLRTANPSTYSVG